MATSADVVEVFECEGSFSFLREDHRFSFTIHSDSGLRVEVNPVSPAEPASIHQELPIRGIIEDIDDVEEEQDARNAVAEDEASDHVTDVKLLAYDGRALVEMPPEGQQDPSLPLCYVVHFKVVQWGRGDQGMWSQIIKCIAHLSSGYGVSGRFVDLRENPEEAKDFSLRPIAHRLEPLNKPLLPLTPGQYTLQGITIAANTFVYECEVNLMLQPNGMMSGTSRELPFTQECPLAGMWTRSGVNYLLQYEMHGNKHTYIYFGMPSRSGLQGTWQNSELRVLGDLDPRTNEAERGILEFQLVKAVRVWSEAYHKDYSTAFRECVKLLLLTSHRDGILPNHLWSSIISYCGYDWFHSELQKSLAPREGKGSDSEAVNVP